MKRLILPSLAVLMMLVVSVKITQWVIQSEYEGKSGFRSELLAAQVDFLRNNSILRPVLDGQGRPDLAKYNNEVNTMMNWYFKKVAEISRKYPTQAQVDTLIVAKRKQAEEEGPRQRSAKSNLPIWEEFFAQARAVMDLWKSGSYRALASDFKGSVRFDVVSVKRENEKLRFVVLVAGGVGQVLYGPWIMRWFKAASSEERAAYEMALAEAKKSKKPVDPSDPQLQDPATLHFAESRGATSHPTLPDLFGSDFIPEFPPGISLNYWDMATSPPEATKVQVVFPIRVKTVTGEDQEMSFEFDMPVGSDWKGSWEGVRKIESR